MREPIRWGVILGAAVGVLSLVFALAGWHTMLAMAFVFLAVAIVINIVTVVLCLRGTASSEGWAGQVRNGLVLGVVASVIIFVASWLTTSVLFPDYFTEMAEGYRESFAGMGMSGEDLEAAVEGTAATSSVADAFKGMVGTIVTSGLVAAIAGIWLRRKS